MLISGPHLYIETTSSHKPLPTQGLWQDPDSQDMFSGCPNPEEPPTESLLTDTNLSVLPKSSNHMQGANNRKIALKDCCTPSLLWLLSADSKIELGRCLTLIVNLRRRELPRRETSRCVVEAGSETSREV